MTKVNADKVQITTLKRKITRLTNELEKVQAEADEARAEVEDIRSEISEAPTGILSEASRIVYGDREKTYGAPDFNLRSIADFWSVFLNRKFDMGVELDVNDVCQMMILLKQARLIGNPEHVDSQVDIAGYIAVMARCQGHE